MILVFVTYVFVIAQLITLMLSTSTVTWDSSTIGSSLNTLLNPTIIESNGVFAIPVWIASALRFFFESLIWNYPFFENPDWLQIVRLALIPLSIGVIVFLIRSFGTLGAIALGGAGILGFLL